MFWRRLLSGWITVSFISTLVIPIPNANAALALPEPGTMVNLSPAFEPVLIKGLKVHPENPFAFDFIVDTGHSGLKAGDQALKDESNRLIKYFLASMTIPEKDLWVNLSPYEKDRMIADNLGSTQMGQDMLTQDYILKQLTASLIYPEKDLGKAFWDKVYQKAQDLYGTTEIPVNTFNKVWIVADKADVFERGNTAYIVGTHLKVMLEEDYTALNKNQHGLSFPNASVGNPDTASHTLASQIVKEVILPSIEQEVNQGKNFAPLRQMFYSMILASWYKMALKDTILTQIYGNQSKVKVGINANNPNDKDKIFEQYLKAYKKGVFNYIKEDLNSTTKQLIPRKYFSGGLQIETERVIRRLTFPTGNLSPTGDLAMVSGVSVPGNAGAEDKRQNAEAAIDRVTREYQLIVSDAPEAVERLRGLSAELSALNLRDTDLIALRDAGIRMIDRKIEQAEQSRVAGRTNPFIRRDMAMTAVDQVRIMSDDELGGFIGPSDPDVILAFDDVHRKILYGLTAKRYKNGYAVVLNGRRGHSIKIFVTTDDIRIFNGVRRLLGNQVRGLEAGLRNILLIAKGNEDSREAMAGAFLVEEVKKAVAAVVDKDRAMTANQVSPTMAVTPAESVPRVQENQFSAGQRVRNEIYSAIDTSSLKILAEALQKDAFGVQGQRKFFDAYGWDYAVSQALSKAIRRSTKPGKLRALLIKHFSYLGVMRFTDDKRRTYAVLGRDALGRIGFADDPNHGLSYFPTALDDLRGLGRSALKMVRGGGGDTAMTVEMSSADLMGQVKFVMDVLDSDDPERVLDIMKNFLDPVALVKQLMETSRKTEREVLDVLKEYGFEDKVLKYRVLQEIKSGDIKNTPSPSRLLEVSVDKDKVTSPEGQTAPLHTEHVHDAFIEKRYLGARNTRFPYRDGMLEYVGRFLGELQEKPASYVARRIGKKQKEMSDLRDEVDRLRRFIRGEEVEGGSINLSDIENLLNNGIGGNEMYLHQLAQMVNQLAEKMGIQFRWIVADNPSDLIRIKETMIRPGQSARNTIAYDMSRSGTTTEPGDLFEVTSDPKGILPILKRIVWANDNRFVDLADNLLRTPGTSVLKIDNTPEDIGGRHMNLKTGMVYGPLFMALAILGSKIFPGDTQKALDWAEEKLRIYVENLFRSNNDLSPKQENEQAAMDNPASQMATETLRKRDVEGRKKLAVVHDHDLKHFAVEYFQNTNEGGAKPAREDERNNNMTSIWDASNKVLDYMGVFTARPELYQVMFLIDMSSHERAQMLSEADALVARGIPVKVIQLNLRPIEDEKDLAHNLAVQANATALLQTYVTTFTHLTYQDANSNPAVKMTREVTAAIQDILVERAAQFGRKLTEEESRVTLPQVLAKLTQTREGALAKARKDLGDKIRSAKASPTALPEVFQGFMNQLTGIATKLGVDEKAVVGVLIGSISKAVFKADLAESKGVSSSKVDAIVEETEFIHGLGTYTKDFEMTPLSRQVDVYNQDGVIISAALPEGMDAKQYEGQANTPEVLAQYLWDLLHQADRLKTTNTLGLAYMDADTGHPDIEGIMAVINKELKNRGINALPMGFPRFAHTGIEAAQALMEILMVIGLIPTQSFTTEESGDVEIRKGLTINMANKIYNFANVARMALGGSPTIIVEYQNKEQLAGIRTILTEAIRILAQKLATDRAMTAANNDLENIRDWKITYSSGKVLTLREALDKLIKEYDIRGYDGFGDPDKFPQQMDPVLVRWLGRALGSVEFHSDVHVRAVGLKPGDTFLIAGDNGPSTDVLVKQNLIEGLRDAGINVIDLGTMVSGELYSNISRFGAQGGLYITRSHVEIGTNGFKPLIGGITLYGDMLQVLKKPILDGQYRKAEVRGLLNDRPAGRTKARQMYFDALRAEFAPLKALLDQIPMEIAINLGGGAGAQQDYVRLFRELLGAHLKDVLRSDPDPLTERGGLPDPSRADAVALGHPKADMVEYSKKHPSRLILNVDLDVDRVGILWNGGLYLGDKMFYPVIEYMLTQDPYKAFNKTFYFDTRMNMQFRQLAEHLGGVAKVHPKGHSKVKATMDVIMKDLADREGLSVPDFVDKHPGFRLAQAEYSLHMFLTNERGEAGDDALRFALFWIEVFTQIKNKYGKPDWTLPGYIQHLLDSKMIKQAEQLNEQRTSIPEDHKKQFMTAMEQHVIKFFAQRSDRFHFENTWRTFEGSDKPFTLIDVDGVYYLKTPIGEIFWGWSNTSPKDCFGAQATNAQDLRKLTEILVALWVHTRNEIDPNLPKIEDIETKGLRSIFGVNTALEVEQMAVQKYPTIEDALKDLDQAMTTSVFDQNVAQDTTIQTGIPQDDGYLDENTVDSAMTKGGIDLNRAQARDLAQLIETIPNAIALSMSPNFDQKQLDIVQEPDGYSPEEIQAAFTHMRDQVRNAIDPEVFARNMQRLEKGDKLVYKIPLRLFDGSGSSFDLWKFVRRATKLWFNKFKASLGFGAMPTLSATITDMDDPKQPLYVEVTFEKGRDGKITYVAPDYMEEARVTDGTNTLDAKGRIPGGQANAADFVVGQLFGVTGIKITLTLSNPQVIKGGGLESSNAFNASLFYGMRELTMAHLSEGDLFGLGLVTAEGPLADITGLQGWLAGRFGNVQIFFVGQVRDSEGRLVNPRGIVMRPLFDRPEDADTIARYTRLAQVNYAADEELARTATLINEFWTFFFDNEDPQTVDLESRELELAHSYAEAMRRKNIPQVIASLREYADIRDEITLRGINLAFDAHEGKQIEGDRARQLAEQLADLIFRRSNDPEDVFARQFAPLRELYERADASRRQLVRESSLYTWGLTPEIRAYAKEHNIAIFPLGAGGPGANLEIVAQTPEAFGPFFERFGDRFKNITEPKIGHHTMYGEWVRPDQTREPVSLNVEPRQVSIEEYDKAAIAHPDKAVVAKNVPGGIDLNRARMRMNVRKEGQGVQMQFDPAMIERIKRDGFDGLDFKIDTIVPITNLPMLLGLREDEQQGHPQLAGA